MSLDSFDALRPLPGNSAVSFYDITTAERHGAGPVSALPFSLRVLVENVLRHENGSSVTADHVRALVNRDHSASIPFHPERILLQDASGIPVLADLLTLQERVTAEGFGPASAAPNKRMDLVVDHALEVDQAGTPDAEQANVDLEYHRHNDRYRFLRWAQERFSTLRVIPPGIGICHQLNLEMLADVVATDMYRRRHLARFDSVVGTDSHTTMINALCVLGWGVGGIEATAAALGQPILIPVPRVVGIHLSGALNPGVLATDAALQLAAILREYGVVGTIIEFHGPGVSTLSVPDRATLANMAPEYGATMAFFPADERTLDYLAITGRSETHVAMARSYLSAQNVVYSDADGPIYDDVLDFDLSVVGRTLAGPSRPHQIYTAPSTGAARSNGSLRDGDVVLAAITSCTNTSNPRAMAAAGLLARNAIQRGLSVKPWTKASLTPGSRATADLLAATGLQDSLDQLGFAVAGFGCGTCMGNSGPLDPAIGDQIAERDLSVSAVLSGNRNFPGRIHPDVANAYLASPPMVIAYAIAGNSNVDLQREAIGADREGRPVLLDDLWPSEKDIDAIVNDGERRSHLHRAALPHTTARWQSLPYPDGPDYPWDGEAGMIRRPPFADPTVTEPLRTGDIIDARPLLVLGDGVTTDHISPVARIQPASPAGRWLRERGVPVNELGTYASRRLNHDVMMRGGFANPRLENRLAPGQPGPWTTIYPDNELVTIYDAARTYIERTVPVVVVAGNSYGAGSARDWAAKATRLLGIQAVIARSFERIHRTNLIAFGVLPIECPDFDPASLDGSETLDISGLTRDLSRDDPVQVTAYHPETGARHYTAHARLDTRTESDWMTSGGLIGNLLRSEAR